MRYKQNMVQHDKTEEIPCPAETKFLQHVGDNTDPELTTIDGKNTHHDLVVNAIANGNFSHQNFKRTKISRNKKVD